MWSIQHHCNIWILFRSNLFLGALRYIPFSCKKAFEAKDVFAATVKTLFLDFPFLRWFVSSVSNKRRCEGVGLSTVKAFVIAASILILDYVLWNFLMTCNCNHESSKSLSRTQTSLGSRLKNIGSRLFIYRSKLDNGNKITKSCIGKNVINLFFENSTRTRVSFELAEKIIGMNAVNFLMMIPSFSKGESFKRYRGSNAMKFDYYVVRHSVPGIPKLISQNVEGIVINAGDGAAEHPTRRTS